RAGDLQNCSAQPWRKNLLDFFFYNCCEINSENFLCSLLMNLVSQLLGHVGGYWNPSTLSGAIDVLVVEQPDGSLIGSPFHARFGKRGVLRPRDNAVEIFVNESPVTGLAARLGPAGEVIFCGEPLPLPPHQAAVGAGFDDWVDVPAEAAVSDQQIDSGHLSEPETSASEGAANS
uniref:Lipin_N domain-containing protein n=1 Tax=Macrostomum lignano TaxID=282301 RepID=A0A1I8HSZ1_9PLAT